MVEAQLAAGECALPMELDPIAIPAAAKAAQSLPALLGGGIKAFFSNLFGIFKSGRKLFSLLILGAIWVAVELLEEKGVDSDVLRLLSTITAAEEDFGKGAITRGFAAAFVCSFLGESGSFKKLFRGIGQFFSSFGKRKGSFSGLLMGLGAALLFACFMEVGDTAPVVLPVFAALLALRSLGGNGYGRRILAAVLPRKTPAATSFLAGWALGVGLAMPFSEYLLQAGGGCLLAGFVCSILFRGRKEAAKA